MSNRSAVNVVSAVLRFCGSIPLGIVLMIILAVAMGWATFLEREMGTPVAQYLVYASPWFYNLIGLLTLNLLFSAIVRLPKLFAKIDGKRRLNRALTPYFIAHIGIILLVFGCLITATKSSKARATIAEGSAVEKAIDVDTRLLRAEIVDFTVPKRPVDEAGDPNFTTVEIPFRGGPLNWRDQTSSALWRADVAEPILALKPDTKFFNKLGKKAASVSQRCAYLASKFGNRSKPGVLYDHDGFKLEALEYATFADYAPVPELRADLVVRKPDGKTTDEKLILAFPFEGSILGGDPLATTNHSQRTTLEDGIRVVYALAGSAAEADAFLKSTSSQGAADCAVLVVDGERYEVELADLGLLAQYGDLEGQSESLKAQLEEINRRLAVEREYIETAEVPAEEAPAVEEAAKPAEETHAAEEAAQPTEETPAAEEAAEPTEETPAAEEAAQPTEETPSASASAISARYAQEASDAASKGLKLKPKQTITREELSSHVQELRGLSEKLAGLADAATSPENPNPAALEEYQTTLREFNRRRVLNYLMTTWNQLENVAESSQELCETLEQMLAETTRRSGEVETLKTKTKLGDSGWRIVSFETTPTQFQGLDALVGWTGAFTLLSPQDEVVDLTLFSELSERNRYPESGRVFGALWLSERKGDDREYGRPWSPTLDKPRLELLQTGDDRVLYRYSAGSVCTSGTLDISEKDANAETLQAAPATFPTVDGVSVDQLVSFTATEFTLQDELGARLLPTLFMKDQANDFYGKLKIRATLDEVTETFWLRTIPLESVDKSQIDYMTKTISSKTRRARVCLSDKEIDLGVALYVKRFAPTYEPGSSTPASFASLTRLLPAGMTPEEQASAVAANPEKDVLIQMNRPGVLKAPGSDKVFWAYQDSFRGPFKPGDKEFDDVVKGGILPGEETPRDSVYYTIISLNDDPGRGLKYLASLLIVWGTALLVYRGKGPKQPKTSAEPSEPAVTADAASSARSGRVSCALLAALCVLTAATFLFGKSSTLRADSIDPDTERVKRAEARRANAALERERWNTDWTQWRLLPVFDGGRRMPLNTFAQIMVRDITGSSRPLIVIPDSTLQRLGEYQAMNMPSLEEFLADLGGDAADKEHAKEWYDETSKNAISRQHNAAGHMREQFPKGSRRFDAAALLFAWIAEPELWEYVPFILDEKGVVSREVLHRTEEEIKDQRSLLSPADFDLPAPGSEKTLVEIYRTLPSADPEVVKAIDKVEDRLANWRSVVFVPTQGASTRPRMCINKILYGSMPSMGGMTHGGMQASPMSRLDASIGALEKLLSHEKRALRKTSPLYDKEHLLRQRTKLSNDPDGRDTLTLARQVALLGELSRRYSLESTGVLFDKLLGATSAALTELREHRDTIMREGTFSLEYRQELERAVSALDEIVGQLERASLALTAEEPKTLNVLPVLRERVLRVSESQDAPWVTLQTLLWSADPVYVRFVDPSQTLDADPAAAPTRLDMTGYFDPLEKALGKSREGQKTLRPAADAFLEAVSAYRAGCGSDVTEALNRFASETRALAERLETEREALASARGASENVDAYLAKTRYPDAGSLDAELFYYNLNAFYWNWVACLCAVGAFLLSYLRQGLLALKRRGKEESKRKGERFFFTIGLLFLTASCGVAFLGGAVRAYITGWAPVANMFETVVLLAFLIAAIAIFYTLAPIWGRPYLNAWRATSFKTKDMSSETQRAAVVLRPIRALLVAATAYGGFVLWLRGHNVEGHALDAIRQQIVDAITMQGFLDSFAVLATFLFTVWLVPRFLVTLLALAVFPKTLCRRGDAESGAETTTWKLLVDQVVDRRAFLAASAIIATLVAASAYFNSSEFNPNIRPLVAVLRSNFWLTIHVIAIIVSYALGAIAWVVSLTSLAYYIFAKYQGRDPEYSQRVAPVIATMLRSAVLFLTAGIILGARWADFSWGRFWSWDPKEVWALVTLLVYLVVLHAHRLSGRNRFVLAIGATVGALAIIMTWYGLSFVMGGGGRHAYTAGESNKVAVLYILFAANILWTLLAIVRYYAEKARGKGKDVKASDAVKER